MITSKELYDLCVEVKKNKIMSKTMQTVGDIYYLRYYCGLADKRADSDKNINDKNINDNRFIVYIVLHHLWTPSRMKYFYDNYIRYSTDKSENNFKDILIKSLIGIDDKRRLTELDRYENASFRAGRIAGFTCEKKCVEIVEDWDNLYLTAKNLEEQWNKPYNFTKLTDIAKEIKWHGKYIAAHLIRSLTYSIPTKTKVEISDWNTLGEMSGGVSDMVKQLGEYATESPQQFVANLRKDIGYDIDDIDDIGYDNENIDVGDAALILCEVKGGKINERESYNEYKAKISSLTKEDIVEIRKTEMRKYGLPEDDSVTYISIPRMIKLI